MLRRSRRIGELVMTGLAYQATTVDDPFAKKRQPKMVATAYVIEGRFKMLGDIGPVDFDALANGRYRLVLEETPARCQDVIVRPERKKKR